MLQSEREPLRGLCISVHSVLKFVCCIFNGENTETQRSREDPLTKPTQIRVGLIILLRFVNSSMNDDTASSKRGRGIVVNAAAYLVVIDQSATYLVPNPYSELVQAPTAIYVSIDR
jgi:hypothetical protein